MLSPSFDLSLLMKAVTFPVFLFIISTQLFAGYTITRLEPPCWWAGMKNNRLELMVYGPAIADLKPVITDNMIKIRQVTTVANPNYLFILIEIDEAVTPRSFDIFFENGGKSRVSYSYQLLARESGSAERIGFNNSDVIYLITPDRFANGNPENDNMAGCTEQANRADKSGRHGGDIKGIADHLDYIADMGFTALWMNPVLENNMPRTSYHGYATTDFYKVDPRYGTNEEYRQLGKMMKERGIKLIMDMIANHCGSEHWWMKDLPSGDWINYSGKYVMTNHRRSTVQDPHVSLSDKKLFEDGWFVESMPDLNQKNPLVARYLIQNSVWWIEYAGLSGIRQDTYSYPDKDFMSRWSCEIMNEYPAFNIVGEEWSENPAIIAYWQKGKVNPDGYTSCLGSLMDFPLQSALVKGLNERDVHYNDGLIKIYEMLANDFLYANPDNLVIFPDNHDMNRFFTQVGGNFDLFKLGIAYILTMRGIPQIYYGTEILMQSPGKKDDGIIRSDFPGGWENDTVNVFKNTGLSAQQLEAKLFIKTLINWRKTKTCLHDGKLIHYSPDNGTYVYFRYNDKEKVMVAINKNDHEVSLDGSRFTEVIRPSVQGRNVITGKIISLDMFAIPARSFIILEL
jgi:glycosidase